MTYLQGQNFSIGLLLYKRIRRALETAKKSTPSSVPHVESEHKEMKEENQESNSWLMDV